MGHEAVVTLVLEWSHHGLSSNPFTQEFISFHMQNLRVSFGIVKTEESLGIVQQPCLKPVFTEIGSVAFHNNDLQAIIKQLQDLSICLMSGIQ